jgi:hypothetical protein
MQGIVFFNSHLDMCCCILRPIGQFLVELTFCNLTRHDSDSNLPRTRKEIYQLNQRVADLMEKTFGFNPEDGPDQHYVPIVPSFGKWHLNPL